jgi:YggT family protein
LFPQPVQPDTLILVKISPYVGWLINIYIWIVIIRVLVSWFNPNQHTPLMVYLRKLVDPALRLTRGICNMTLGGMDFTPVLLILGLSFLGNFLPMTLKALGLGSPPIVLIPIFVVCLLVLILSLTWFICLLMVLRLILSMISASVYNPIVLLVYGLSEPILAPLRNMFPKGPWGLDYRALFVIVTIVLVNYFVLYKLRELSLDWMYSQVAITGIPIT